jgi:peptidoglycan/xylan/chitin deacetylase (PgdA/CDA1 family)
MIARGLYATGVLGALQAFSRYSEYNYDQGALFPKLSRTKAKCVVLCYHRIGTGGIPLYSGLPPAIFESQMAYIRKHYRLISVSQLIQELRESEGTGQSVAITFDDGYRDLFTHAFPVLRKYAVPATVFVTAGSVESGEIAWYDRIFLALKLFAHEQLELELDRPCRFFLSSPLARINAATSIVMYLRSVPDARRAEVCATLERKVQLPNSETMQHMLRWEQVRTMHRAGIHFGSHTMTHRVLSRLSSAEQQYELQESKKLIEERLGTEVLDFAYPFGKPADCGETGEAVARSGYRSAMTTCSGVNVVNTNAYQLRRVQIGEERSLATFAFYLTQLFFQSQGTPSASR